MNNELASNRYIDLISLTLEESLKLTALMANIFGMKGFRIKKTVIEHDKLYFELYSKEDSEFLKEIMECDA